MAMQNLWVLGRVFSVFVWILVFLGVCFILGFGEEFLWGFDFFRFWEGLFFKKFKYDVFFWKRNVRNHCVGRRGKTQWFLTNKTQKNKAYEKPSPKLNKNSPKTTKYELPYISIGIVCSCFRIFSVYTVYTVHCIHQHLYVPICVASDKTVFFLSVWKLYWYKCISRYVLVCYV